MQYPLNFAVQTIFFRFTAHQGPRFRRDPNHWTTTPPPLYKTIFWLYLVKNSTADYTVHSVQYFRISKKINRKEEGSCTDTNRQHNNTRGNIEANRARGRE